MTQYQRGASFERRVKKYLEEKGYYVIRSAGSHGFGDLVAFKYHNVPMIIQCKYGKTLNVQRELTIYNEKMHTLLGDLIGVIFILACGLPREKISFYDIRTKWRYEIDE